MISTPLASCPSCGTAVASDASACPKCNGDLREDGVSAAVAAVAAAEAADELEPGTRLGSYRIIELLGEGGMGRVYAAEHVKLGRRVALKMLRSSLALNPVAVARFFAEARAVNRISHDHIVEITDFFENPGGKNYYIMELLRGEDLGRVLLRSRALPVGRAADIARQVASVLAAVHAAGIVHRDLKPDNIFLIERAGNPDFVKLLDFGVAKLTDTHDGVKFKTTAHGAIIGTPEYMSPEQAGGQPVDHRTDVYALGVILYEMLAGHPPFKAKSFGEMVVQHMTVNPKRLGSAPGLVEPVPAALEELVHELLAKEPDERPATMAEVEDRLVGITDYLGDSIRPRTVASMPILRQMQSGKFLATRPRSEQPEPAAITGREPTMESGPARAAIGSQNEATAQPDLPARAPTPSGSLSSLVAQPKSKVKLLLVIGATVITTALVTRHVVAPKVADDLPTRTAPSAPEPVAAPTAAPTPAPAPSPAPVQVVTPAPAPVPAKPAAPAPARIPSRSASTTPKHAPARPATKPPQHRADHLDRSTTLDVFK